MDLGESHLDRHEFAVRAGRHVAERQHAGKDLRRLLELEAQDVPKPAFLGLDDGAEVMSDQSAEHDDGVLDVAQIPGAVECVQVRHGKAGRISDVVQPCGGFQQIGVSAENGCQAACPCGDAPDVCPAAGRGSWRSARARCWAQDASVFMRPRLESRGGTFTDVACRLKTSWSASCSVIR
jgi:hypothetical protein